MLKVRPGRPEGGAGLCTCAAVWPLGAAPTTVSASRAQPRQSVGSVLLCCRFCGSPATPGVAAAGRRWGRQAGRVHGCRPWCMVVVRGSRARQREWHAVCASGVWRCSCGAAAAEHMDGMLARQPACRRNPHLQMHEKPASPPPSRACPPAPQQILDKDKGGHTSPTQSMDMVRRRDGDVTLPASGLAGHIAHGGSSSGGRSARTGCSQPNQPPTGVYVYVYVPPGDRCCCRGGPLLLLLLLPAGGRLPHLRRRSRNHQGARGKGGLGRAYWCQGLDPVPGVRHARGARCREGGKAVTGLFHARANSVRACVLHAGVRTNGAPLMPFTTKRGAAASAGFVSPPLTAFPPAPAPAPHSPPFRTPWAPQHLIRSSRRRRRSSNPVLATIDPPSPPFLCMPRHGAAQVWDSASGTCTQTIDKAHAGIISTILPYGVSPAGRCGGTRRAPCCMMHVFPAAGLCRPVQCSPRQPRLPQHATTHTR